MKVTARPRRLSMSEEEVNLLGAALSEACGFALRPEYKFVAERRLTPRLEALGLGDFAGYHHFLRLHPEGPEELERAIELLVPRETYFFRELSVLQSLAQEVLPELRRGARGVLRVWSAGCSTGEEAYSLAMVLGAGSRWASGSLDVLGTDRSTRALARARDAEYGPTSVRSVTAQQRAACFEQLSNGWVRVKPRYREPVRFQPLNLLETEGVARLPQMHLIVCRNVLLYFESEARRRVVRALFEQLLPGGVLLMAQAENLLPLDAGFELVQVTGNVVYRRPDR